MPIRRAGDHMHVRRITAIGVTGPRGALSAGGAATTCKVPSDLRQPSHEQLHFGVGTLPSHRHLKCDTSKMQLLY
jgi:hypothetical protein